MDLANRPFPNDPQWQNIARKLPPDAVIIALIKFGFLYTDIANRFDVNCSRICEIAAEHGMPPIIPTRRRLSSPWRPRYRAEGNGYALR